MEPKHKGCWKLSTGWTFVLLLCVLLTYFYGVYLQPSRTMLNYFAKVTTSTKRPRVNFTEDPSLNNVLTSAPGELNALSEFMSNITDPNVSPVRTKYHMMSILQLVFDYPVGYFIVNDLGLKDQTVVTANTISFIHPIFGIIAAALILRADRRDEQTRPLTGADGTDEKEMPPVTPIRPGVGAQSPLQAKNVATPVTKDDVDTFAMRIDTNYKAPTFYTRTNLKLLRIACGFYLLRNFLDTMDGVLARLQKNKVIVIDKISGGHMVDMITDFFGVFMIIVAVFIVLWRRQQPLSHLPKAVLARLGVKNPGSIVIARLVLVLGLLLIVWVSIIWQFFQLRFTALFDMWSNTYPSIGRLERNFNVQLTCFFWSFTCADFIFNILIAHMWFDRLWVFAQGLLFVGYPWVMLVAAQSFYSWWYVILPNPLAAKIVSEHSAF